ncbi:dnaJ homolog subfamily C member 16 [Caerostris darwini]|uniref:DnaJ homolog subfamily C member 16 n=1 Tax=Caerostris darwini TaxID=1538125 RepID=A0AAV4PS99_9ARAC|nr:dnaJ homolog subfamily C member 16 [Caerostris darwini]
MHNLISCLQSRTAFVLSCIKLLLFFIIFHTVLSLSDPYATLGVHRSASITEIKQAYKRLAREWHPDKNKEPEAESKFIEINKAYELLTDPERKRLFDRSGVTEDTPNFRHYPDYSQFRRYEGDPFEHLFSQGGFNFQYKFSQGSFYHRHTVTAKAFENQIVPNSNFQPYLILIYGELCFACINAEPIWRKLIQELEPLGVGFAAIHAQQEASLTHKMGVSSLPYLIGVVDGRALHYKDHQLSFIKVVDFCRRILPSRTMVSLSDYSVDDFLLGWHDNRVRVLIFSTAEAIRLRYLLVAFRFRNNAAVGHIRIGTSDTEVVCKRYNIQPKMESLLIFNEDSSKPIATLSMTELTSQTMSDVIEANKFLLLPRLSSQNLFDQLCPTEAKRARKYLCVILITKNVKEHDPYRALMREFIQQIDLPNNRVRFMFLFEEKQKDFVKALSSGMGAPEDPILHVVLIWRKEHDRVKYQWLEHKWDINEDSVNATKDELNAAVKHLMQKTETLPYDAQVSILADEHALGLFARVLNRMILMGDVLWDNITRQELLPALSVMGSIAFIALVGYIMTYLVQLEEQSIQERYQRGGKQVPGVPNRSKPEYHLHVHELRGETYNGLVRLLKPGCRTLVLLLDNESKMKLLPIYYKIVYPYRKNKTLMFAFLMIEKNLEWYRHLLLQTLGETRELNINPKNCIGTVLSLVGHRKYFCVYHAKHAEQDPRKREGKIRKGEGSAGEFIGFEDSNTDSENSDVEAAKISQYDNDIYGSIVFEEHLLDGLPNWLDRLFEGSTRRYYIQYWPENMK